MPTKSTPTKRTLASIRGSLPTNDRDAVLLGIEGQEVEVARMEVEERQGKLRKYKLTTVTLVDGRTFTVSGSSVAYAADVIPEAEFPIWLRFVRQPSDYVDGQTYWTVE